MISAISRWVAWVETLEVDITFEFFRVTLTHPDGSRAPFHELAAILAMYGITVGLPFILTVCTVSALGYWVNSLGYWVNP